METRSRGQGELLSDPSSERARQHFRTKSRVLADKRTTVHEAVKRLVLDGDYLAVGGLGSNRIPTAILHEILRQEKQNLRFSGHTATHDFQLLCAGNLTGRGQLLQAVDVAYIVGLEARGLSPHARRVMESGTVRMTEWTNYITALRYKAAAMGVPFLPAKSLLGTETFQQSHACEIICPFTKERLAAVPALYPDIAAIHVPEADCHGNCRLKGPSVADLDLARAARKLIITCERLVPTDEIRRDPTQTVIPFWCVDAVCEVPFGSYPGNMPYEYFSDEKHLMEWMKAEEDPENFKVFLQKTIFDVKDFAAYLQICGGLPRLQELRQQELFVQRT